MRRPLRPSLFAAPHARGGFSLIEIMIVIAIIGVLTSAGYIVARDLVPQYRTRRAAMDFANHVEQCRALAISSGRRCRVQLSGYDPDLADLDSNLGKYSIDLEIPDHLGWDTLPVDTVNDTTDDEEGSGKVDLNYHTHDGLRHVAIMDWGSLAGPSGDCDDAIVFDTRGFVDNPASDFTDGYITVTFVNKVAEAKSNPDRWAVQITRAGLPKLVSSRRPGDDTFTGSGTDSTTTYAPDGPFGSP